MVNPFAGHKWIVAERLDAHYFIDMKKNIRV